MKIQLEVPEGEVGKSVLEIFNALGHAERRDLARQVMADWLKSAMSTNERALREKEVIEEIKKKESHYRDKCDADVRDGYRFKEIMQSWRSGHERLVKEVSDELVQHAKEQARDVVRNDPKVTALMHEVVQIVKDALPKMIHDAMMVWFLEHMATVLAGVAQSSSALGNLDEFKRGVSDRLGQVMQRLGMS